MATITLPAGAPARMAGGEPVTFTHDLVDELLLGEDSLSALAARVPPEQLRANVADLPRVLDADGNPDLDLPPGELVRVLEAERRWMTIMHVEDDVELGPLVRRTLGSVASALAPVDGGLGREEGYLFLSASGSVTPAHIDHEHNLLCQVRGTKHVTIGMLPIELEQRLLEGMYTGRYGRADREPDDVETFTIGPGEGVYIPPRGVHLVENGEAPSLSFSLVWSTPALARAAKVHAANARLRKLGLHPRPPGDAPAVDAAKAAVVGAWQGARRRLG